MRRGLLLGDVVVANCTEPPGDSGGHEARFMLKAQELGEST